MSVLRSAGVLEADSVRAVVEQLDGGGRLLLGQRIVVRAWTEPQFRARLLEDADTAAREMGIEASNANAATKVKPYAKHYYSSFTRSLALINSAMETSPRDKSYPILYII